MTLYTRPGCHLCDVARETLLAQRARSAFDLEEVDIDGDDELELEYGIRVPVVEVDGEEVFEVTVDAVELAAILDRPPSS